MPNSPRPTQYLTIILTRLAASTTGANDRKTPKLPELLHGFRRWRVQLLQRPSKEHRGHQWEYPSYSPQTRV